MDEATRSAFITLIDIMESANTEDSCGLSQHESFDALDKIDLERLKSDLLDKKVDE